MLVDFKVIYFSLRNRKKCLYRDIYKDHNWPFLINILQQRKGFM